MKHDLSESEKRELLLKIVKGSHTAFFVTVKDGVQLHGRPMATAQVEDDLATLWFASERGSGKVAELRNDSHVLLGYVNSSGAEWASLTGTARLVDDRAKIKALWSPFWKNWFEGPDDPKIVLIAVKPDQAEFWHSGSRLVVMAKLAFTAVTGKKVDEGVNEKVAL